MHLIANAIDMQFVSHVIGVLVGIYIFKIARGLITVMRSKDQ
jgi:hypothetical protein